MTQEPDEADFLAKHLSGDARKLLTDTFGPEVAGYGTELKSIMLPIHETYATHISTAAKVLAENHHNSSGSCSTSGWRAYQTPDHWVIAAIAKAKGETQ